METKTVRALFNRLRAFSRDRRGAIGIIFALSILPMLQLVGLVLDYSNLSRLNARLKAAADAGTLSVVRDIALGVNEAQARAKGTDIFNSDLKGATMLVNPRVNFSTSSQGTDFVTTGVYNATVQTHFS